MLRQILTFFLILLAVYASKEECSICREEKDPKKFIGHELHKVCIQCYKKTWETPGRKCYSCRQKLTENEHPLSMAVKTYSLEQMLEVLPHFSPKIMNVLQNREIYTEEDQINLVLTYFAVQGGNINLLNELMIDIDRDMEPGKFGDDEKPILHIAIENKEEEMVKILLENEIDITLMDKQENTFLHIAAQFNFPINVFRIDTSNLINKQNKAGDTPFMIALKNQNIKMIKFLLKHKSDVTLMDVQENTILHIISEYDLPDEIITLIISRFGSTNFKNNKQNKSKETPLMIALKNQNIKMVQYLLRDEIDVTLMDEQGNTILHIAVEYIGLPKIINLVLDKNDASNLKNVQNEAGDTPLMIALDNETSYGKVIISTLLSEENPHISNNKNQRPIHRLLKNQNFNMAVEYLEAFDYKKYENKKDRHRFTPLDYALKNNKIMKNIDIKSLKILISNQNYPWVDSWEKGYEIAQEEGNNPVAKFLKMQTQTLRSAVRNGNIKKVKEIIDQDVFLNVRVGENKTPLLQVAIKNDNGLDMVELLLKNKIDVTVKDKDKNNILHVVAIHCEDVEMLHLLTLYIPEKQMNLLKNQKNAIGNMPLITKLGKSKFNPNDDKQIDFIKLLITEKNTNNVQGKDTSPLHAVFKNRNMVGLEDISCKTKNFKKLIQLLNYEQKIDHRDDRGETALYLALKNEDTIKCTEIIKMLISEENIKFKYANERTAMHIAAQNSNLNFETLNLLSQYQIQDLVDSDGNTALHLALENLHFGNYIYPLLISSINVDIPNNTNEYPLHYALTNSYVNPKLIKSLITINNCDKKIKVDFWLPQSPWMEHHGKLVSPLDIAKFKYEDASSGTVCKNSWFEVIKIIEDYVSKKNNE